MTSVGSNFLCVCPRGAESPPGSMRPREPDLLLLRLDVINGWSLTELEAGFMVEKYEGR